MAKLKKHAEVLNQLHTLVKASSVQNSVTGTPHQLDSSKVDDKTEHIDKNKVKPEDLKNEYDQTPSKEEAGKTVSAKKAEFMELSEGILGLLNKAAADAQETVTGKPTELGVTAVSDKTEDIDKNKVKPDDLKNEYKQTPAVEEAGKAVSSGAAKTDTKDEAVREEKKVEGEKMAGMAAKIASYQTGANIVRDLLKQSGFAPVTDKTASLKAAGARDMELLINEAVANLKTGSAAAPVGKIDKTEIAKLAKEAADKEAAESEAAGAAYFEELHKVASEKVALEKLAAAEAKVVELEAKLSKESADASVKEAAVAKQKELEEMAVKVAAIITASLKNESSAK